MSVMERSARQDDMSGTESSTETESSIAGQYVHVRRVAQGGMGYVELAFRQQGSFRRLYAVKRLHPHLRDDSEFRAMFLEEARIAGLIQHPNVVAVLDVGEDEAGPYLVLDYVRGLPLSALVSTLRANQESIPVQIALRIGIAMADGLHAAHDLRDYGGKALEVVHRDVSPQNVLIGWDGTVRITDFGIAKALGRGVATTTGILKGKVSYMAPEQLRFQRIDRRADLFGLGVVIYEMLTNERLYPNKGENEGIRRILEDPPPDIGELRPDLPSSLVQLLFGLLAKEPQDRPSDAAEVSRRLQASLLEVLAKEPPVELGPWLRAVLAEEYERSRNELEAGLEAATHDSMEQSTRVEARGVRKEPAAVAEPISRPRPTRRRLGIGIGTAVIGALAAVLLWSWFGAGGENSADTAPERPATGSAALPTPDGDEPAGPTLTPSPAEPDAPEPSAETPADEEPAAATEAAPSSTTRRHGPPRSPPRVAMARRRTSSTETAAMDTTTTVDPALQLRGWGEGE